MIYKKVFEFICKLFLQDHDHDSSMSDSQYISRSTSENSIQQVTYDDPYVSASQQHTPIDLSSSNELPIIPVASPFMKSASLTNSPMVDNEGFSIPDSNRHKFPGASDVSSQNTSEEIDSDYQSFQQSQKLQINITDQIVKEGDMETNQSFNRMASILREKTPTVSRKARGRRDTTSRAFTDSTLFNNAFVNPVSDQRSRSNSVLSSSSGGGDSNLSNPFLISNNPELSPVSGHSPISHSPSDPSWQLQSIQEVVNPMADIAMHEMVSMDENGVYVSGQLYLNYTGSSTKSPPSISIQPPAQGTIEDWFVQDGVNASSDNMYTLNNAMLESGQSIPMIQYKIRLEHGQLPIHIHPAWKCTPDTSFLIVKYNWNEAIPGIQGTIAITDELVTGVQSTPQGVWETATKTLSWSLQDIMETRPDRLLAKLSMSTQSEPKPVHLQYQYEAASSVAGVVVASASQIEIKSIHTKVKSTNVIISP